MPMGMGGARRGAESTLGAAGMQDFAGEATGDEGKVPMAEAGYRQGDPMGAACGACANFQPPDRCAVVAGQIDPAGVSDLFEPIGAAPAGQEAAPVLQ
ncbi:MAG: hypothetical protein AB7G37_06310 [Solirubrobacteraceae bacterium]